MLSQPAQRIVDFDEMPTVADVRAGIVETERSLGTPTMRVSDEGN
jgi:hypothetical protein